MFEVKRFWGKEATPSAVDIKTLVSKVRKREKLELSEFEPVKRAKTSSIYDNQKVSIARAFSQLQPSRLNQSRYQKKVSRISENDKLAAFTQDESLKSECEQLGLPTFIYKKLHDNFTITSFFSIQKQSLTAILQNKYSDVSIGAPTGSGKTLAYCIPIVADLETRLVPRVRALIVVPTTDLANQVSSVLSKLTDLKIGVVRAVAAFDRFDILITTPGLLADNCHNGWMTGFTLEHLRWVVYDEADRLLADKHTDIARIVYDDVYRHEEGIVKASGAKQYNVRMRPGKSLISQAGLRVPKPLRKIICSATVTENPEKLERLKLFNPIQVSACDEVKYYVPTSISNFAIRTEEENKPLQLAVLLQELEGKSLVFTNSLAIGHRLTKLLQLFFADNSIQFLSSKSNAKGRTKMLESFERALITTDISTRGLDIPDLKHVINFDVPTHVRTFVHRVGRTGRALNTGKTYSLVTDHELPTFTDIIEKSQTEYDEYILDEAKIISHTPRYDDSLIKMKSDMKPTSRN